MELNKTLNLPKTAFPMKADLPNREKKIQEKWEEMEIYKTLMSCRAKNNLFLLHDGPPYANGNIHMGHALNKILKDMIIKYRSLKGDRTPFIPGWDCHGLPIEYQLFKELGKKKGEIGQVEFRIKAARYAEKYINIQRKEFKRLGIIADWDNPYITMSPAYESSIIKAFKDLFRKGLIYQGKKPVYWCSSCETALAEAEVEYMEKNSPSVYVKFRVAGNIPGIDIAVPVSALIWTTTPWTLPANLALAFHPEHIYALVEFEKNGCKENLIMAKQLMEQVMEKSGVKDFRIKAEFQGAIMKDKAFLHPFLNRESRVVLADFVSLEEGTGIVHIAPGHGQEDFQIGIKYGLDIYAPVDSKGLFTKDVPEYSGQHVFDVNGKIVDNLASSGSLLYTEEIVHSYPHCWRCKSPIVFRATEQWFLKIDEDFKKELLKNVQDVRWIPSSGENRIYGMIQQRPDWCLSRQRYWGVPLPVFYCSGCRRPLPSPDNPEEADVLSVFQELVSKEGSDIWFKKSARELLPEKITCPSCGSNDFEKEDDILDVWFDSGVSHEAVLKNDDALKYPADLYLEGSDQHRGWFQTSLIPAVALDSHPPFRTVLTHGFVVDGEGKKMSKSTGNVISPQEIISTYGADILRLWVASEDYRGDMRISSDILKQLVDTYRKIRNTFRYLLGNLYDFGSSGAVRHEDLLEIDRYMMHRLDVLIRKTDSNYAGFEFHKVYRDVYNFCAVELSSFYFDILKDRLYTSGPDSIQRRSAQTVLYKLLVSIVGIVTPILSHTAEEVWSHMPSGSEEGSVFLKGFPDESGMEVEEDLIKRWEKILEIRDVVYKELEKARSEKVVGNSLEAKIILHSDLPDIKEILERYGETWKEIFIVSQVLVTRESPGQQIPGSGISVKVERAEGSKCHRCWNYNQAVVQENPVCPRCREVITKYFER